MTSPDSRSPPDPELRTYECGVDFTRRRVVTTITGAGAMSGLALTGLSASILSDSPPIAKASNADKAPAAPTNPRLNGKPGSSGTAASIPAITWIPRSDWINVKTDVHPPAKGNGTADDSVALQAALDRIGPSPGDPKVVYLPPGTYRTTQTLVLRKRSGGMLVGHGRDTVLLWGGRRAGRMFWSDGAAYQSYLGLVWDGAGKAAVGIDHASKTRYETRVLHEYMEFRNFRDAGIRVGHHQKLASAEMLFSNLSFRDNRNGVAFLSWNDYNNVFEGCSFTANHCAIRVEKGNIVVRDTRFESSGYCDLFLSTHSHSVRRSVSVGSRSFIRTSFAIANCLVRVEDCRVDGWRDPGGAIVTGYRGPLLLFDVAFTNPPGRKPPIRLDNPGLMNQIAILSNVTSPGTRAVIDPGTNGLVYGIPIRTHHAPLVSIDQHFLGTVQRTATRVLDVKRDFGAKGDGTIDDTLSLQRALNAAHRLGEGTAVYFPSGTYRISKTLRVLPGAAYRIEGTGWHSRVVLAGGHDRTTVHIEDPDGLRVEHLGLGGPPGTTTLLQTGTGPASVHFHNVFGYDGDEMQNLHIVFDALPTGTVVTTGHLDGRIIVRGSSEATLLLGFLCSVQMMVEGSTQQTGFTGVLSRASALEVYPLIIRDNQSLVMTDWYNESTKHLSFIEGAAGRHGRVIIDHTQATTRDPMFTKVVGYRGLITEVGGMFGRPGHSGDHIITVKKGQDLELLLIGDMFWFRPPRIDGAVAMELLLGNSISGGFRKRDARVENHWTSRGNAVSRAALDAFRQLGILDLGLNYGLTPG